MKTKLLLICIFLAFRFVLIASQNHPYIFIDSNLAPGQELTDEQKTYLESTILKLSSIILKEFNCANILTGLDLKQALNYCRQAALLGNDEMGRTGMEMARNALNADYIVYVKINSIGNTHYMTFELTRPKRGKMLLAVKTGSGNGIGFIDQLISEFIEEMAYYEICPYKGNLELTENTTKITNNKTNIDVFCNEQFQQHVIEEKTNRTEKTNWKLERNGRGQGIGDMTYKWFEVSNYHDEDPCYTCESGRTAGRTYTKEEIEKAEGSGISTDAYEARIIPDSLLDAPFADVRIKIKFEHNGTYFLQVEGSSNSTTSTIKVTEEAIGSCDLVQKNENHTRSFTIPVSCILGPFNGKPLDKTLKASGTQPIDKGETTGTYEYNFELTR